MPDLPGRISDYEFIIAHILVHNCASADEGILDNQMSEVRGLKSED